MPSKYHDDDPNFHVVTYMDGVDRVYVCFTLLPDNKTWLGIHDGSLAVIDVANDEENLLLEE